MARIDMGKQVDVFPMFLIDYHQPVGNDIHVCLKTGMHTAAYPHKPALPFSHTLTRFLGTKT